MRDISFFRFSICLLRDVMHRRECRIQVVSLFSTYVRKGIPRKRIQTLKGVYGYSLKIFYQDTIVRTLLNNLISMLNGSFFESVLPFYPLWECRRDGGRGIFARFLSSWTDGRGSRRMEGGETRNQLGILG